MPDDDLPSLEFEMGSGRCIRAQERRYQEPHERRARSAMVSERAEASGEPQFRCMVVGANLGGSRRSRNWQ